MAGGADDVDDAGCRRQFGERERRRRQREFDQAVGLLEERRRIGNHLDAIRTEACKFTRIAADRGGARRIHSACQDEALGRGDSLDECAPHAPAGTGDHHPHIGSISSHRVLWGFIPAGAGIAGRQEASNTPGPVLPKEAAAQALRRG